MQILISLLILGVLIFVHEFGHFITAKLAKMPVSEFSLGMGPSIYSYVGQNTTYSIRSIPVGGYVNIEGMELDSQVEDGFNTKSTLARFVVLVAGVTMNFILAYLLVFGLTFVSGEYRFDPAPIVGQVMENTGSQGTLESNDKILSIDDVKINEWKDISATISKVYKDEAKSLDVLVERNGQVKKVVIKPIKDTQSNRYLMGVSPKVIHEKFSFGQSIIRGAKETKNIFVLTVKGLGSLFTGKAKLKDISGPIGIVKIIGTASKDGVGTLVYLAALLSVNLGIVNLFPFPGLDGGRILFVILEIFGIKINKKTEEKLHYGGVIILFSLIFLICVHDIMNIF